MIPHLDEREGADAERRGLVGSGGLLRSGADLRGARDARHARAQLPRRRPLESRRLGRRPGDTLGPIAFGSATGEVLPRRDPGAVVRLLPEGQGHARPAGGADLRGRLEPLAALGRLAADAPTRRSDGSTSGPNESLVVRSRRPRPDATAFDDYVSDPAHPVPYRHRPIQPTYFPGGSKWSDLAGRGSAVRRRPRRRAELGNRPARRGR